MVVLGLFSVSTKNINYYEYISKALNPSMSDLHEAQSAVHVQLKPSKQLVREHSATVVSACSAVVD